MKDIKQYEIYLVNLDPTIGYEIKKTRPAVVISPNEMNRNLKTVIIAPLTTNIRDWPTRIKIELEGKIGEIALDQIRTIDKSRLIKKISELDLETILQLKSTLKEMLVD